MAGTSDSHTTVVCDTHKTRMEFAIAILTENQDDADLDSRRKTRLRLLTVGEANDMIHKLSSYFDLWNDGDANVEDLEKLGDIRRLIRYLKIYVVFRLAHKDHHLRIFSASKHRTRPYDIMQYTVAALPSKECLKTTGLSTVGL